MDLEIIILSKSERERQIPYNITSMWIQKYDTNNLYVKEKQTHRHRKQTYSYQRRKQGWGRDGLGVWG